MHRYSSCNHFYSMKCKCNVRSHLPLRGLVGRKLCHVIRYCYRVESSLGRWVRSYYIQILSYVLATTLGNLNAAAPAAIAHGCDHQSASVTVDKAAGLLSQMHLQRSMLQTTCSLSVASTHPDSRSKFWFLEVVGLLVCIDPDTSTFSQSNSYTFCLWI